MQNNAGGDSVALDLFLSKLLGICRGGDVAQLVERQTGTPLRHFGFPGAARDFSSSQISVQALLHASVHPRVQPRALTSARTLKIP